jgi:hypothetical protein
MKTKLALLSLVASVVSLPAFSTGPNFGGSWNITGEHEPNLNEPFEYCFDFTTDGSVLGADSGTFNVPSWSPGWTGSWYRSGDDIILTSQASSSTFFLTFIGTMQDSKKIAGRQTENYASGALDEGGTFFGTKITGSCPTDAASPKTGDPTK